MFWLWINSEIHVERSCISIFILKLNQYYRKVALLAVNGRPNLAFIA